MGGVRKVRKRNSLSEGIFVRIRRYLIKRCLNTVQFLRSKISKSCGRDIASEKVEDLAAMEENQSAIEELRKFLEDKIPDGANSSGRANTATSDAESDVETLTALLQEISSDGDVIKCLSTREIPDGKAGSVMKQDKGESTATPVIRNKRIRPKAAKGERTDIVIHDYLIIDENAVLGTETQYQKKKRPNAAKGKRKVEDQLDLPAHLLVSTLGGCNVRTDRPQAARKERKQNACQEMEDKFQTQKASPKVPGRGIFIEVEEASEKEMLDAVQVLPNLNVNTKPGRSAHDVKEAGGADIRRSQKWDDMVVEDLEEIEDLWG